MGDVLTGERNRIREDSHILQSAQHAAMQRILAFLNLSIDDVVDDPIARAAVHLHWRVEHLVQRRCAAVDAEHMRRRLAAGQSMINDDYEAAMVRSIKVR